MDKHIPTYQEAEDLFLKYNETESLIKHGRAVSAVLKNIAEKHGEEVEKWAIVGLIHDLDYEKYPDQHCVITKQLLEEAGWDDEYVRAVLSHGWGLVTDIEPITLLEKYLFAVDELTGLITACALVRPTRSFLDMKISSVKKKWKQKSFAAGANREVILKGAELLTLELDQLIQETLDALKQAEEEGLKLL